MYQLINDSQVRHLASGAVIPLPAVESYGFAYEEWLAAGNTPQPPDKPSAQQIEAAERGWRDGELLAADIQVRKAADISSPTEAAWRQYRNALRDWPQSAGFPDIALRPLAPSEPSA